MPTNIIPTAEPFYFRGDDTGCLLVHGFTGTPKEVRPLGEYLAGRGYSALGVRLPGHATRPADMIHTRWRNWLAAVEDGWHLLRADCRRVFLLGLSMGGALSLLFASRFPAAGVVALSTPVGLPVQGWQRALVPFVRPLSLLKPYFGKRPAHWINPAAAQDHVTYPVYPTRSVHELKLLLGEMRAVLPRLALPVLLVHSLNDQGVEPEDMESIYAALGSPDKSKLLVEECGHIITRDGEPERVFEAAAAFIRRVGGGDL